MEITYNQKIKYAEVWLSSSEQENYNEKYKSEFDEIRAKGYQIAVFMSGKKDLYSCVEDLIIKNSN